MRFIDPHIHMSARTTDDYERMAAAGIVAVIEPAFWLGQPRTQVGTFIDYLSSLVGWERFRASQFGIRHYCTIGLNSKEANNEALAEQVHGRPAAVPRQGGRGCGRRDRLRRPDRGRGQVLPRAAATRARTSACWCRSIRRTATRSAAPRAAWTSRSRWGWIPDSVVIDHNNEETVQEVLDRGFWAAFTLYPETKMGNERMVEIARALRLESHLHRLQRRLGQVRSARGAEDGAPDARARHSPRRRRGDLLRQCTRGLRPERTDEGGALARSAAARPAHALPGQLRAARPGAARGRTAGHPANAKSNR